MKTLTNYEMEASLSKMGALSEKGKLGYAIAYNRRVLSETLKEYFSKRDEIIVEFGEPIDDGSTYKVKNDRIAEAQQALDEYGMIKHEVAIMEVDLDTFCSGELTSDDMYTLNWMVKEESDTLSG